MEVISRGLVPSNKENPFIVRPNYHNWAPWVGPHTRSGNVVLNTEYRKVHSPHSLAEELELNVTEDRLTDELLKVKMDDQCGCVDSVVWTPRAHKWTLSADFSKK